MLFNIYGSPKLLFSCPEISTVPDPRPLVGRPFSAAMVATSPVPRGCRYHGMCINYPTLYVTQEKELTRWCPHFINWPIVYSRNILHKCYI